MNESLYWITFGQLFTEATLQLGWRTFERDIIVIKSKLAGQMINSNNSNVV